MSERSSISMFLAFIVTVVIGGYFYTLIHGVLAGFGGLSGTPTMQFLDYVVTYMMLPITLVIVLWYMYSSQSDTEGANG